MRLNLFQIKLCETSMKILKVHSCLGITKIEIRGLFSGFCLMSNGFGMNFFLAEQDMEQVFNSRQISGI